MSGSLRFAFVSSSAGSIMDQALRNELVRRLTVVLVCDRLCPALDKARAHGLDAEVIPEPDPERFGEPLLRYLRDRRVDYVFSFYTQFYSAAVRVSYRDRILNFHPSLLPAFKGMDGFADGCRYGVKFLGTTVELVDEVMDEGKIVMQTLVPRDPAVPDVVLRHRLFVQQCKSLLQAAKWLVDGRVHVSGRWTTVSGARFDDPEFSPALDWDEARRLEIPLPGAAALAAFETGWPPLDERRSS